VEQVITDLETAEISDKFKALLRITALVAKSGTEVTDEAIQAARDLGATDREIHDTVLVASAFCMFNRYVDGLRTWAPEKKEMYQESGQRIARHGYVSKTNGKK